MLRGYRCFFLVLGLILTCPSHAQTSKNNQPLSQQDSSEQLARIAAAIEKQPVATAPDRGCKPGHDDRQSDLCAQWKAADAAAESARWALWTMLTAIVGLILGGGTLFAAWRAAHWAKKAAEETERGANAAETALEESRNQLRPYVAFSDIEDEQIGPPFSRDSVIKVRIQNFGPIPAQDVTLSLGTELHERPISDFIVPLSDERRGRYGLIAPGDSRVEKIDTRDIAVTDIAEIAKGEMKLIARFRVDYTWVGGSDFHDMTLILLDPKINKWGLLDEYGRKKVK